MNNPGNIPENFPIQNVLVVDDDPQVQLIVSRTLERTGLLSWCAGDAETALQLLEKERVHLVISDINMPGDMDGIDLLREIKSRYPLIDVIIMTGYGGDHSYVDIMDAGASDYMTKPFNLNAALARIKRIAREKTNLLNLKKTNQELCRAIERSNVLAREAEEASKAKTFFLASMSHEIRTPLNGIVGYTDLLQDTPLTDEQKMFLKNARLSCETLLSVVNDILDFSKVEAGKLTFENMEFDPEIICFDTIDVIRTKLDESRVELLCHISENVPGKVISDPHRFRQVLLNLMGNAVKFTPEGSIKLELDAELLGDENVRLSVKVKDTGIGIAEEKLEKIFHPFIQSEDDITSRYGGTGLGLAISKNIASKMGGDVQAARREDKGSVFHFTCIVKAAEKKEIKRVRPAVLKNKKVLFSTQTKDAFDFFSHDLKVAQMVCRHFEYDKLKETCSHLKPGEFDVGMIDFGKTAKINVKEFEDRIKDILPLTSLPVWIACCVPVPGIARIFHRAGFKGFLPKPVSRQKLFEMMAYLIGMGDDNGDAFKEQKETIVTAHLVSENKKHSAGILLVEDNPVNQKMTQLLLSKAGYTIEIAANGKEGFEAYQEKYDHYDLIFMDINMPFMNGFEAARAIRAFERDRGIRRTPILALTANVLDDFRKKCTASGMDDFLTKPIRRDKVFQAIQAWTGTG